MINKEESYAERRKLFKNIWHAAMQIDEKDDLRKPKIIKTLRLDEIDKYAIGKSKKERIKSLRVVCNKILDFCDRRDADDVLFGQMTGEQELLTDKFGSKSPKPKLYRRKKNIRNTKSLYVSPKGTSVVEAEPTTSEKKTRHSREPVLPMRFNKTSVIRRALVSKYNPTSDAKTTATRRKIVRKKRVKRNIPLKQ